jgi:hypothetical protein
MKRWFLPTLLLAAMAAAFAAVPRVSRAALAGMELSFDKRIRTLSADIPFELLGNTRGVYLEGYGAVFTSEVNLAQSMTVTPFSLTIPKEYAAKLRQRKLARLPVLTKNMQEQLLAMASSLDAVPPNEHVVLGVTLFYHTWEDRSGLPSQIVMQAERQKLLDVQLGRASRSSLDSIVKVQEL